MKLLRLAARCVLWALLAMAVLLLWCQAALIYHPNVYQKPALWELEKLGGHFLSITTSQGKQTAFYLPARKGPPHSPEFLWFVFGGNGSLALDYLGETLRWDERFAYVFVDYPGYGLCEGNPNSARIAESIKEIAVKVRSELHWSEAEMQQRCGVLGHSLGCAAALIAADDLKLTRAVLCAPFTTMTAMARGLVGWPLCYLNYHGFDNVSRLAALSASNARVRAFHGQADEVIPVTMSRELVKMFPQMMQLQEMPDCHHAEIVMDARTEIGSAMLELSGLPRL